METDLRPALLHELPALSALCLRSKAFWGYDTTFLDACRDELSLQSHAHLIVAQTQGAMAGVAQVTPMGNVADLGALFVDPPFMGRGIGRQLLLWCLDEARRTGAERLSIEADPNALGFYEAMGARVVGAAESGSVKGRFLPRLEIGAGTRP